MASEDHCRTEREEMTDLAGGGEDPGEGKDDPPDGGGHPKEVSEEEDEQTQRAPLVRSTHSRSIACDLKIISHRWKGTWSCP